MASVSVWAQEKQSQSDAAEKAWRDMVSVLEHMVETRCRERMLAAGFQEHELQQGFFVRYSPGYVDGEDPRMPAFKPSRPARPSPRPASRETELAKEYPIHVVTSWLGNTPRIALKHYLQVTDADFERAAEASEQGGAKSGARSAQKAAQPGRVTKGGESHDPSATPVGCAIFATLSDIQLFDAKSLSGEDRIRTPHENTGESTVSDQSGAESGAIDDESEPADPNLSAVIDAWPTLPGPIKAGILAMVRAAGRSV